MDENVGDLVIEELERKLNPLAKKKLVDSLRERHWRSWSYRQGMARVDQWLDPDDPHEFPLRFVDEAIRVIGDAGFLDALLAVEIRVMREKRKAAPVRVVRHRKAG